MFTHAHNEEGLRLLILESDLTAVSHFLEVVRIKMRPWVFHTICELWHEPQSCLSLAAKAFEAPILDTERFAMFAHGHLPFVFNAIRDVLDNDQNLEVFCEQAQKEPADRQTEFLGFAREHLPRLSARLRPALARPARARS